MKDKDNISRLVKLESIPDEKQIKLINQLSYTYIDSSGIKHIQNLKEFDKENQMYYGKDLPINKSELESLSKFIEKKRVALQFIGTPNMVLWDQFQTNIRNQKSRNICAGFAIVAAIEARYKRDYGLDLDLSEQFFWHCYKSSGLSFPKYYKYENQSSFWGGGNSHGVKVAVNFSIPLEQDCPFLDEDEMKSLLSEIPEAGSLKWQNDPTINMISQDEVDAFEYSTLYIKNKAREKAKYGAKSYKLLNSSQTRSTPYMEFILLSGYEVIVDAELKWKILDNGIREYDSSKGGNWHSFLIVGYNRNEKVFYAKNSWGEDGLIRVSYEFARKCFSSGSIISSVTDPEKPVQKNRAIGRWQMNHDGKKGVLTIRRFTYEENKITRLGHYRGSDGSIRAINGKYVHGGRGINFFLTGNADSNPSDQNGQPFTMDIFTQDINQAAGNTIWANIFFGSYINRLNFHSSYEANFKASKWIGNWEINYDGSRGEMVFSQLNEFPFIGKFLTGYFRSSSGSSIAIFCNINKDQPHNINVNIDFPNENFQSFRLYFHTWSSDLASGYTMRNGERFGVVAFKKVK